MKQFYKVKGRKIFFYSWQLFFLWPGTSQRTKVLIPILPDKHKKQIKRYLLHEFWQILEKFYLQTTTRVLNSHSMFHVCVIHHFPRSPPFSCPLGQHASMAPPATAWSSWETETPTVLWCPLILQVSVCVCVWWVDCTLNLVLSKFVRAEIWMSETFSKA